MNLLFDDIEVHRDRRGPCDRSRSAASPTTAAGSCPGDLFCCVPGRVSDGHAHAAEAVERGAVGLLCEHFIPELLDRARRADADRARARCARSWRGWPPPSTAIPPATS